MATNPPAGDGHRNGAVRKRSQLKIKIEGEEHWTKRGKKSGQPRLSASMQNLREI